MKTFVFIDLPWKIERLYANLKIFLHKPETNYNNIYTQTFILLTSTMFCKVKLTVKKVRLYCTVFCVAHHVEMVILSSYTSLLYLLRFYSEHYVNKPLNDELNPICHLQALLGAHHILHVFRIMVKFRLFSKSQKI